MRQAARLAAAGLAWLALGAPRTASAQAAVAALPAAPLDAATALLLAPLETLAPLDAPAPAPEPIPGLPELGIDLARLQADFDIPIQVNARVLKHLREYASPGARRGFLRWIAVSQQYAEQYGAILEEHGVPRDLIYLAMVESGFRTHARSPVGAVGPWQFMVGTGRELGLRTDRWVDERRDPEKSARAAARFLRRLHDRLGDWHLAWAAYNAGAGRVTRALRRGYSDFWHLERQRLLPVETRDYVAKIIAAAILARHAAAFGLEVAPGRPGPWAEYELVIIPRARPLAPIARAAGVSVRALRELNPELRRDVTPPRPYVLRIPRTAAGALAENWPRIWPARRAVGTAPRTARPASASESDVRFAARGAGASARPPRGLSASRAPASRAPAR